ncbi:separin protein [Exophiala xenobiotica]|nr:separin protein [Exophiala xenobiotica]KAK5231073.1 separin protein [Exophiala xenobiotica]KAK5299587.1 separin protein [Exophiala xenobiotica]KAK5499574.1 separin protein [Exophiala xenobiotica]
MTATSHPSTVPTTNAIRAELNLPAPTIHTLRFLRSILGLDDQDSVSTTKFEKKKTHTATRPTKHQVPINGKTKPSRKAAPGLQIHEAVSKERPSLSQVERRQIATETFNTTLKQLSDAAKAEKSAAKSYTAGTTPSKPSPAAQPLQERSPNKETRKNGADPKGKLLCAEEADWEVVAGCAQSALQFLRKHQSAEGNAKQDLSLDTEGAALMLLDRTITLGLLKQAELQLADIHRQYWGDASKDLPSETTLAGFILGRPNAACQLSRFRFTTSMQSQGLRLAILAGARCISMDFLNSLQLKTVGSPAWITQQGLNEGRHNSEAAGMQLRTISLALSKLYSTATKTPTEATSSINLFELFCTALEIKFESWRHLCHTVDPGVEVWRPFQGAAKRLFSSAKDVDASMAFALQYLCLFQKCLKNTNIESSIPSTIVDMLSQVPHETGASTEFLALLEEQLPTADKVDRLVLTCQIAQWRLKAYSGAVKAAIDSTQRVTDTFNKALDLSQADFERVLLHAAHLRKTAVGVVMTIEKAVVQDGKSDRLQNTVLNLLYTSCWFFCNQIQPKQRLFSRDTGGPASSVFVSTLLKNVDAILTVEKFAAARTSTLAFEALKNCATILESLEAGSSRTAADASLRSTVDHLRVRLSNAFWSRYLTAVKQKNLHEQIHVLQLSLDGLSVLTLAHQKAAYLALKNERLAACYMESNELGRARLALQNALDFNIKEGALSDTVELALAGSLERAWSDPDTNSKALARNLTAYVRLSLQLSCEDDSLFYDDQSLPAIHRAVLLEKQIYAMVDKDLGERQSRSCLLQTNLVLELLHQEECQVYRLRLANNLLHCALKRQLPLSKCPIDTATVEKLLHNHTNPNGSVFLRAYELGLRSILKMQHGFFTSVITCEDLEQSVQQVSQIVRHCKTMDDASNALDNLEALTMSLRLSVDRAGIFENHRVRHMALETLIHLLELSNRTQEPSKASVMLQLGELFDTLQDLESANKTLRRVETAMSSGSVDSLFAAEFALAYAQHYFDSGDIGQCFQCLDRARTAWDGRQSSMASGSMRLREQTILCRAAMIASQLAHSRGQLLEAATNGRQAVKIAAAIWMSIEKLWDADDTVQRENSNDSQLHNLTVELSKLDLSLQHTPQLSTNAARLWPQVVLYISAFRNLAYLTAHSGLYQDAMYFYEQALKVATKTVQSSLTRLISSELALVHARASQPYKASTTVEHMPAVSKSHDIAVVQALTAINQSEVHLLLGDVSSCRQYFLEAIGLLPPSKTPQKQIEDRPTSRAKVPKGPPRAPAKKPSARPKGRSTVVPEASTPKPSSAPARSQLANEAKEQLSALQIKLNLAEGCSEVILHNEASAKLDGMGSLRSATMQALSLVRQALKMLSEDADTNVLAETAMALPVRYKSARKSGRISFVQSAASQSLVKNTIRMPKGDAGRAQQQSAQDGKELLVAACDILLRLKDSSKAELSSDMVHTAHKIWTQISLLSTVLGRPFVNSSLDLVLDTLSPMDVVRLRERTVMMSEMSTTEKTFVQSWPKLASIHGSQSTTSVQDSIDFDMSLLPASWTIVSLGVSEDRTELLVSRVYADRSPFMLRIPLTRPDMSDGDIEELDFDGAKAEMQQIISKANSSAHDPRGSSPDKAVRKAWYAERQVLDRQLATLLDNIENVWFGGFRGLLSASDVAEKMVYKFSQSFSQTLSRHLPSRQKPSKQAKARVELHSHVLELFVTLGNPREADLEDSITDLLYFVVDILQFNGEKNAYDEIDFDAMLVEVLDALHVYHDEKAERPEKPRHTIMVLDKALQLFPWESMSCLKTCAVSRMPSLGTIWDHLHKMHAMKNEHDGYCIPSSNGAYILNPSSDLLSTQNTFSKVFADQLKGFEAIVDRPPKESEFESILRNKPLLLYFGHGGGAQYIRGRTIRKLDKCAVTMLMGCSSAKMTECGVYEPYGMPWNYINGGSPAVVGTLWDVTDRDIDRFALEVMADWGLIESDGLPDSKPKPGKKKAEKDSPPQKGRCITQQRGTVSLDEAVAHARDACLLKYLNGAAPVMYGVPVFLA